jgi:hypothetical protein
LAYRLCILALGIASIAPAAHAAQNAPSVEELRARIAALEAENERRAAQVTELRAALDQIEGKPAVAAPPPALAIAQTSPAPQLRATVDNSAVPAPKPASTANPLQLTGDVRLRYEQNWGDGRRDRGRGVVRGRLRATYAFDKVFSAGARLVTGDPDDPNTADVTLTQFDDDLVVALDQLFGKVHLGALDLYGGKFDNPFIRTDLVWDGDVNPEGIAAVVTQPLAGLTLRASGLYFLVDENSATRDSVMAGGQLGVTARLAPDWQVDLAGSYYDYTLPVLIDADAGDFRSNLRRPDGRYLSDFNLLDIVGSLTFTGLGPEYPVKLVGDYVSNTGAAVADDEGFGADIFVGRASQTGAWRFQYGYAEMGVDGVLAAFSHDNTDLPTNYLQHTAAVDFVPVPHVVLNLTYYRYRLKNPLYAGALAPGHWSNRLRVNLIYGF